MLDRFEEMVLNSAVKEMHKAMLKKQWMQVDANASIVHNSAGFCLARKLDS